MSVDRQRSSRWLRELLLVSFLPLLVMILVAFLFGIFTGIIPVNACITKIKRISDFSGLYFEIEDDDCDAFFYKGESMSVLVSRKGRGAKKTLLFKFTPVWWVPPPDIKVDNQKSTILISVAMIGSTYSRLEKWRDMTVEYDIWKPDEPRFIELQRRCQDRGC